VKKYIEGDQVASVSLHSMIPKYYCAVFIIIIIPVTNT